MAANQDDELAAIRAQRLQQMQDQLQEQAMQQLQAEEVAHAEAQTAAQIDSVLAKSCHLTLVPVSLAFQWSNQNVLNH